MHIQGREGAQVFHLLVSFLVFASIVAPWLPVPRGLATLQMNAKAFVDTPHALPPPSALCPTTTLHSPKEYEGLRQHPTPSNMTLQCPKGRGSFHRHSTHPTATLHSPNECEGFRRHATPLLCPSTLQTSAKGVRRLHAPHHTPPLSQRV
jgi:hypothetical protein